MNTPKDEYPVVAKIRHLNSLGTSEWWEVIYFDPTDQEWHSYGNSETFEDGEIVLAWFPCSALEMMMEGFVEPPLYVAEIGKTGVVESVKPLY